MRRSPKGSLYAREPYLRAAAARDRTGMRILTPVCALAQNDKLDSLAISNDLTAYWQFHSTPHSLRTAPFTQGSLRSAVGSSILPGAVPHDLSEVHIPLGGEGDAL